jgi:putative oxidoreductase
MSAAVSFGLPTQKSVVAAVARTEDDRALLALRVAFAAVMFPHGAQHALGWFGGFGYSGTHQWMTTVVGVPSPLAALAIVVELLAPLALLFGVIGRLAALGLGVILAVAATTHAGNGFFMNWLGNQKGEGYEFHLLGIAIAVALLIRGSGALSVDRWLTRRTR